MHEPFYNKFLLDFLNSYLLTFLHTLLKASAGTVHRVTDSFERKVACSKHSHKNGRCLETRANPTVYRVYVENRLILEPSILLGARNVSKY